MQRQTDVIHKDNIIKYNIQYIRIANDHIRVISEGVTLKTEEE